MDFSVSARKVAKMLELSKIYSEKNIKFSFVIALNIKVLEDIINLTGPIYLEEYDVILTSDNFLEIIQKEVETGENKKINKPKKILRDLTPLIISKISSFNENDRLDLLSIIEKALNSKDIQLYSRDEHQQNLILKYNFGGTQSLINKKDNYFAVAHSNIAGGKTDRFISRSQTFESFIDANGEIINTILISRTHNGTEKTLDPWYRADNQDYAQVFMPIGSKIIEITGTSSKKIIPAIDYLKAGYATDTDVFALETGEFLDRSMIGAWTKLKSGETSDLKIM